VPFAIPFTIPIRVRQLSRARSFLSTSKSTSV
jgi:hypothetical protein